MVITYDIVVIGGGIIGENILYSLKQHTDNIAIIDDSNGYKASHAAGGMLGAQNEFTIGSDLYKLSMLGQQMMPEHIQQIERLSGLSIDLVQQGLLKIASKDGIHTLKQQFDFLHSKHNQFEWVDADKIKHFANGEISKDYTNAIWIPTDGQVNAVNYLNALKTVNHDIPHLADKIIDIQQLNGYYHLYTSDNTIIAQKIVIAAGCRSEDLLNLLGINFTMYGVKGEVLTLHHPDLYLKETLFQTNGHYIVPKSDHRYLIGATTSLDNNKSPSTQGVQWLLDETFKLIPKLQNSKIVHIDVGFRPDSALHRPIIDQLDDHVYIATGHYRNGILLSRITGEFIRQMIYAQDGDIYLQFKNSFQLGAIYENLH